MLTDQPDKTRRVGHMLAERSSAERQMLGQLRSRAYCTSGGRQFGLNFPSSMRPESVLTCGRDAVPKTVLIPFSMVLTSGK